MHAKLKAPENADWSEKGCPSLSLFNLDHVDRYMSLGHFLVKNKQFHGEVQHWGSESWMQLWLRWFGSIQYCDWFGQHFQGLDFCITPRILVFWNAVWLPTARTVNWAACLGEKSLRTHLLLCFYAFKTALLVCCTFLNNPRRHESVIATWPHPVPILTVTINQFSSLKQNNRMFPVKPLVTTTYTSCWLSLLPLLTQRFILEPKSVVDSFLVFSLMAFFKDGEDF